MSMQLDDCYIINWQQYLTTIHSDRMNGLENTCDAYISSYIYIEVFSNVTKVKTFIFY